MVSNGNPPEVIDETAPPVDETPTRTTAEGTAQRLSTPTDGAPLTNQQVREAGALGPDTPMPAELRAQLDDAEERLRRQTLGEGGQEPENIEHRLYTPPEGTAPPGGGRAGAFYGQATNYIVGERDIFASSVAQVITSYTLDAAAVTADANGDKVVMEGTVLQASGAKVAPRTSGAAVGICRHRVNARMGDQDIGMVIGGRVRSDKCWDNGVFGSIAAGAVTQLNALGIYLTTYDV